MIISENRVQDRLSFTMGDPALYLNTLIQGCLMALILVFLIGQDEGSKDGFFSACTIWTYLASSW